jgi:hypothetical protein
VLKNEARRYDVEALRDTRLAIMDRTTFHWLFENSVVFNRFLVRSLNERLGQFIALLEYGRMLDATARLARSIASLFNPILYPDVTPHLEITQEEIGAISGISRQNANRYLRARQPNRWRYRAGRGQVGPCPTDEAHRPLPACCSQRAATLKPEQMQQRLLRQFYPVVSLTTSEVSRPTQCARRPAALHEDRLKSLSIGSLSVKMVA